MNREVPGIQFQYDREEGCVFAGALPTANMTPSQAMERVGGSCRTLCILNTKKQKERRTYVLYSYGSDSVRDGMHWGSSFLSGRICGIVEIPGPGRNVPRRKDTVKSSLLQSKRRLKSAGSIRGMLQIMEEKYPKEKRRAEIALAYLDHSRYKDFETTLDCFSDGTSSLQKSNRRSIVTRNSKTTSFGLPGTLKIKKQGGYYMRRNNWKAKILALIGILVGILAGGARSMGGMEICRCTVCRTCIFYSHATCSSAFYSDFDSLIWQR